MTLLDAYALIAFAVDEPAAGEVEAIIREGEAHIVVINLAESIDVCRRIYELSEVELRAALEPLLASGALASIASGEADAWRAGAMRAEHYDRRARPLSTADCFLLAHAAVEEAPIATADPEVAAVARTLGVELVALPDSSGARP